jgi:AbrB family looped-hinge helix DNA binding protein
VEEGAAISPSAIIVAVVGRGQHPMKGTYTIQEKGQVSLPEEWLEKYGLKEGDEVVFEETDQGLLLSPRVMRAMKLLDEIGDALKEKGITLEEMIESGREIRQEIYDEKYARDQDE